MQTLFTNPNLLILQADLMAPTSQGLGKWIIFVPEERNSFLAIGKQHYPKILSILTYFSIPGRNLTDARKDNLNIDELEINILLEKKLLLTSLSDTNTAQQNFLSLYQLANYNYPFNNYLNDQWVSLDFQQMEQFKKLALRPLNTIKSRDGEKFYLAKSNLNDINEKLLQSLIKENKHLNILGIVLFLTFGEMQRIYRSDGTHWIRKTSPSGGARHPTEGYVYLARPQFGLPAGIFVYDYAEHALIKIKEDYLSPAIKKNIDNALFSIIIKSHVERAMWRYREIRALRPVLMDAGHTIETLAEILSHFKFQTNILFGSDKTNLTCDWLQDPTLAIININQKAPTVNISDTSAIAIDSTQKNAWQTNSSLYFTLQNGQLIAHILWPHSVQITINTEEFLLINYCLFSRRDDRDTHTSTLYTLFPKINIERLTQLQKNHILLDKELAKTFYKKTFLWSEHGWYLSHLAYLVMTDKWQTLRYRHNQYDLALSTNELITALSKRKTYRSFSSRAIQLNDFTSLLNKTSLLLKNYLTQTNIYVAAFNIEGLDSAFYEFDLNNCQLIKKPYSKTLDRQQIRAMTTGQIAAGAGAVTLWVTANIADQPVNNYMQLIILLGMLGQRICIYATHLGLGVFLTPALCDEPTYALLQLADPINTITYSFTIGYPGLT